MVSELAHPKKGNEEQDLELTEERAFLHASLSN